jgi:signal transduction histidine kinase
MILDDRYAGCSIRVRIWQLAALSCGALAILGLLVAWGLAHGRDAYDAVAPQDSNILALVVVAGCGVAGLLILGAAQRIVGRIDHRPRELIADLEAMKDDDLTQRIAVRSNDEIGRVATAFNQWAERLQIAYLASERGNELGNAALAQSDRSLEAETEMHGVTQANLLRSVAELKRSNNELDSFAYAVSHDLKAPLRGIRNLTDWITEDARGKVSKETEKNLSLLHRRVDRLDKLLDSLLQYSRVGRVDDIVEVVDTAALVDDIAGYLAPHAGFIVSCQGEMPIIHAEKAPLEQVLLNLIGNGLKHHDRTVGTVTVTARDIGDAIEFCVADDGPGIETEFHARIFQMFQTLKSRDILEGNGMGLAIVKKSVEGHGGTIRVISAPPVRGSTFVFTWVKAQPVQ